MAKKTILVVDDDVDALGIKALLKKPFDPSDVISYVEKYT